MFGITRLFRFGVTRFSVTLILACSGVAAFFPASAHADDRAVVPVTLFENVRVFDGVSDGLSQTSYVLVRGNIIEEISERPIPLTDNPSITIIPGEGRVLMPGLIDAHWHTMMVAVSMNTLLTADIGYLVLIAGAEAERTLMRGFTSVRDLAGPSFALKRAIDEGVVVGPRIWPSGAMISQTSGHGDFRMRYEIPRGPDAELSRGEIVGGGAIADGVDEVLRRTREQLMLGASQIKLAAGGGVSSMYDPLDVSQYTAEEFKAAVEAADNWGTYVTIHAYTPKAIQTAIQAGVKVVDHGQLIDEETAIMMSENGTWLSIQPFLDDEDSTPFPEGSYNRAKQLQVAKGTERAIELGIKYKLNIAWGTDTLFDAARATRQGAQLAKMVRWFSPGDVLKMATAKNAELLALSGLRSPYQGKLGVVEKGAMADLLLVNGNPLDNIGLLADPQRNLTVIMKNGVIYKNLVTVASSATE
ncbi:MAG: amidohydrolase family protein [Marinobacter sp.]|uniref:metal-dependent hydrolase family protein n=1 Tax=Marinobacter sp. TaxID=50741 RepID=UPI0034A05B55